MTVAGPGLTAAVDFLASLAARLPPLLGLRELLHHNILQRSVTCSAAVTPVTGECENSAGPDTETRAQCEMIMENTQNKSHTAAK